VTLAVPTGGPDFILLCLVLLPALLPGPRRGALSLLGPSCLACPAVDATVGRLSSSSSSSSSSPRSSPAYGSAAFLDEGLNSLQSDHIDTGNPRRS
jgi:hypothetical protein